MSDYLTEYQAGRFVTIYDRLRADGHDPSVDPEDCAACAANRRSNPDYSAIRDAVYEGDDE